MSDIEPNGMMVALLVSSSFVGNAETIDSAIRPLDEQLSFGIGDVGILAASNTPLERDFAIVKGLDASQYAATYPDWEERMLGLNNPGEGSYVLCEYFSKNDPVVSIGWFNRLKILPITSEQYDETVTWLRTGFPDDVPQWAEKWYQFYADQLSEVAPDRVPHSVPCQSCGSLYTALVVSRTVTYDGRAGRLVKEGKTLYIPVGDPEVNEEVTAHLKCSECQFAVELEDPDWDLPGITS